MSKKTSHRRAGVPATDLLESAAHLLRSAPASTLLLHFIGSVPGLLGALYFVADMSQSAFAAERLVSSAGGLAALYLWMKCWQAAFAAHLRAILLLEAPPRWSLGRILRLAGVQSLCHPLGLLLRPLALVVTLPAVWMALFFQNVTALGDGREGLRAVTRQAIAQARLWPGQAHVFTLLLLLFAFFVWVNLAIGFVAAPMLLKMFLGIETAFSRHLDGYLNTTFFSATFAALYLCVDPIRKAAVVVRCFQGGSLRTGDDLEVQLRTLRTVSEAGAHPLQLHPQTGSARG